MLVHSVFFWLKPELDSEARQQFRGGLESLAGIESAEQVHVGVPAATPDRPVIDASYDFALTVLLRDMAAHDAYQQHPLHQNFLERFSSQWETVRIYDAE